MILPTNSAEKKSENNYYIMFLRRGDLLLQEEKEHSLLKKWPQVKELQFMHVTIDFHDASIITRSNYRIRHFLVSFRTVTTPNAENNS